MPRYPKLTGTLVYLALPSPDDAELRSRWLNDLEVALPLGVEAYSHFTADDQARDLLAEEFESPVVRSCSRATEGLERVGNKRGGSPALLRPAGEGWSLDRAWFTIWP